MTIAPGPKSMADFEDDAQKQQFDKSVLVPDLVKLVGRFETALGQAWVADCQSATSDKRLKAVWANVEEKRNDLLAALRLLPSARGDNPAADFAAQLAALRSYEALNWAANWIEEAGQHNEVVRSFAKNMAMTIRAEANSRKGTA